MDLQVSMENALQSKDCVLREAARKVVVDMCNESMDSFDRLIKHMKEKREKEVKSDGLVHAKTKI